MSIHAPRDQDVLDIALPAVENVERAKKPQRLPVVLTRAEVKVVLSHLTGTILRDPAEPVSLPCNPPGTVRSQVEGKRRLPSNRDTDLSDRRAGMEAAEPGLLPE
jgi:hypothetical protein